MNREDYVEQNPVTLPCRVLTVEARLEKAIVFRAMDKPWNLMEVKDNWKDNESKSIHLQCKRGLTLCNRVVDHHREEDRTATEIFINKCL